jgi:hypothetical protein
MRGQQGRDPTAQSKFCAGTRWLHHHAARAGARRNAGTQPRTVSWYIASTQPWPGTRVVTRGHAGTRGIANGRG